jgi:hypothetical protein
MYHSHNFCGFSGASIYKDVVADTTDLCNKEIDPPVDAKESDNTPDNKATDLAPFDIFHRTSRQSSINSNNLSDLSSTGIMTPPQGYINSDDNNSNSLQNEYNLITPMINKNSSITKTGRSGDKSAMTGSLFSCFKDGSSCMMKSSVGEDNKIERAFAAEQSQKHTIGTKPDEDDTYEQDNKKRRFAESNSSSITGSRQMKALSHKQKSRLFLSDRSKHYEFSQYNRILLVIPSVQSDNKEYGTVHILNPSIEAADRESLRVYDHIVKDYPGLIFETGRTETSVSFQLHELVPFAVELCKEMLVTDNSSKEKTGVRSAVLRDGSLDKVFANCIRIVTNEYVNNVAVLNTVESFHLQKFICYHASGTLRINYSTM